MTAVQSVSEAGHTAIGRQQSAPPTRRLDVLIISEHAIVRAGLKHLLLADPDIGEVTETRAVEEAVERLRRQRCSAAILDVFFLGPNAIAPLRKFVEACPGVPVLAFGRQLDGGYASQLLKRGASGYITEDVIQEQLVIAIRAVAARHRYLDPSLVEWMLDQREDQEGARGRGELSGREFTVLCMMGSGQRLSEIAAQLHISAKTAHTYRERLKRKTGLHSNAELIRYAIQCGFVR